MSEGGRASQAHSHLVVLDDDLAGRGLQRHCSSRVVATAQQVPFDVVDEVVRTVDAAMMATGRPGGQARRRRRACGVTSESVVNMLGLGRRWRRTGPWRV